MDSVWDNIQMAGNKVEIVENDKACIILECALGALACRASGGEARGEGVMQRALGEGQALC